MYVILLCHFNKFFNNSKNQQFFFSKDISFFTNTIFNSSYTDNIYFDLHNDKSKLLFDFTPDKSNDNFDLHDDESKLLFDFAPEKSRYDEIKSIIGEKIIAPLIIYLNSDEGRLLLLAFCMFIGKLFDALLDKCL